MRRLCLLLAFAGGPGCVSDTGTGPFDAALKDLRGDNMQMGHPLPGARVGGSLPATVGD